MKTLNTIKDILIGTLLTLLLPTFALGGGNAGGGSTGLQLASGKIIHLDLYLNNSQVKDDIPGPSLVHLRDDSTSQAVMDFNFFGHATSMHDIEIPSKFGLTKDQPHFKEIKQRLDIWKKSSPILTEILSKILEKQEFTIVKNLQNSDFFFNRPILKGDSPNEEIESIFRVNLKGQQFPPETKLIPTALFDKPNVYISSEPFSLMGYISQQAVFLKEATRTLQNASRSDTVLISDVDIQVIVYKILMTTPTNAETLDLPTKYGQFLSEVITTIQEKKQKLVDFCRLARSYPIHERYSSVILIHCIGNTETEFLKNTSDSGFDETLYGDFTRASMFSIENSSLEMIQLEQQMRNLALDFTYDSVVSTQLTACISNPYSHDCGHP